MTKTAELPLPATDQLESPSADPLATEIPEIKPKMARLLELTQANGSSVTPREINAQLDRVLRDYDELTALYAENNRRIDSELAELRQSGGAISTRMHQLGADLQQQGQALAGRTAAAEQRIDVIRDETRVWLADSEQRWDARLASNNARIGADLARLDAGIGSLDGLLKAQERILAEQHARLDQFDITCELLDTATRGNKSRIEAVREEAQRQHAIVAARLDGLAALQREHYAEFQTLQGLVGVLQTETRRLDEEIAKVAVALDGHRRETGDRFKRTHLALAALLLLAVAGFAMVKWVPAFAPASTESALADSRSRIAEVGSQVAALAAQGTARDEADARQQASIEQVSGKVSGIEKSLGDLRSAVRKLRMQNAANAAGVVRDGQWLLQQNPRAYTVQLVASPSEAELARFIERNADRLALDSLAISVTEQGQRDRYNLYFGVFPTSSQARAAIADLPPELRANKPWVRQFQTIQNSLR